MEMLKMMKKELAFELFYYQEENYYNSEDPSVFPPDIVDSFKYQCSIIKGLLERAISRITPTPLGDAKLYSREELKDMICNYYFLGWTMYGRLFKGSIKNHERGGDREVIIVKTWDFLFPSQKTYADHPSRFCNELEILIDENRPSSLMKLKGFCFQHVLAVVYDEKPTKFLLDELRSGRNFGWNGRMKVATQLASLFTWLHEKRFAFGSVKPSGIMIDKDFNIKVFDFGFLVRVSDEDNSVAIPHVTLPDAPEARCGTRTLKSDVYIFGVLLVELIGNNGRSISVPHHRWILKELQSGKRSIVDNSLLQENDELSCKITEMAVACLEEDPNARPDMKDVYTDLSNLVGSNTS